ncbi:MAG: hypothetical protein NT120_01055 [Candidatus Aenigmarchaeota archaeon]|nr:hypothetical protein [Candidatus Aenigmarchaeota archaeon]
MIAIVDNGKGADDIERFIRGAKEVVTPNEALKSKASAFILTDGDMKHQKANVELIKKTNKPLLGIGIGYIFLGVAYGAKTKETKFDKTDHAKIEHACPLTLDLKKMFTVMQNCRHAFIELPENFQVVASSPKYEYKIISENNKPFFGVHFNPEMGGDGLKIIDNFVKFVDIWGKYHS